VGYVKVVCYSRVACFRKTFFPLFSFYRGPSFAPYQGRPLLIALISNLSYSFVWSPLSFTCFAVLFNSSFIVVGTFI